MELREVGLTLREPSIREPCGDDGLDVDTRSALPMSRDTSQVDHRIDAVPLIVITDPGQDLDDEMAFIAMCSMVDAQLIDLRCVICNLHPSFERALLARGTFDMLGMHQVRIAVGTDGGDLMNKHKDTFSQIAPYMPNPFSERALSLGNGRACFHQTLLEADGKITLLLISSLKDAALFLRDNEELFLEKVGSVVIMGGVEPMEEGKLMVPDTAHNNEFDRASSEYFYRRCQELGVPLVIVTRNAAYASPVPRQIFDVLAQTGNVVGWRLRNAQRDSIEALWRRAASPAGQEARMGLPDRCDRSWFKTTFCGGNEAVEKRGSEDTIWDMIKSFNMYDSLALLAAVPSLRETYFESTAHAYKGTCHQVIGIGKDSPLNGIAPGRCQDLQDYLTHAYQTGLMLHHHSKANVLIVMQLDEKERNDFSDALLGLTLLRALVELQCMTCLGIVLSSKNRYSNISVSEGLVKYVEDVLVKLGLQSVKVFLQHPALKRCVLEELYEAAPPTGVQLIVAHAPIDVAEFMLRSQQLFFKKTMEVVVIGGVTVPETQGDMLQPDFKWNCNSSDKDAADFFTRKCQEHCVPMTIICRSLPPFCKTPRQFYDILPTHGGAVGSIVTEQANQSLEQLWQKVKARALPARCDEQWFAQQFCDGNDDESISVWERVSHFTLFMPFALLIATKSIRKAYFKSRTWQVRGITHNIYDSADHILDVKGLADTMMGLMLKGVSLNTSHFPVPDGLVSGADVTRWREDPDQWDVLGIADAMPEFLDHVNKDRTRHLSFMKGGCAAQGPTSPSSMGPCISGTWT